MAGLALIWRNASPEEQATLRRLAEPLSGGAGPAHPGRRSAIRLAIAGLLILGGGGLAGLGAPAAWPCCARWAG